MTDIGSSWVYVASYTDSQGMELDHVAVRQLHSNGDYGGYDVVELHRGDDGKLHVHRSESSTRHGAWGGLVAGALVGLIFPPAIIGTAAIGAGLGAVGGHLEGGLPKADIERLATAVEDGHWGMIVVAGGDLDQVASEAFAHAAGYEQAALGGGVDQETIGRTVADTVEFSGSD